MNKLHNLETIQVRDSQIWIDPDLECFTKELLKNDFARWVFVNSNIGYTLFYLY